MEYIMILIILVIQLLIAIIFGIILKEIITNVLKEYMTFLLIRSLLQKITIIHKLLSLCIDAGSNAAPAIPPTDKDDNPRIIDGNNDGVATVDMGAYEYQGVPTAKKE
jgi:hypothetical protein